MRSASGDRLRLDVIGMHCASCGLLVDDALEDLPGVVCSTTDVKRGRTEVLLAPSGVAIPELLDAVRAVGYQARLAQE